MTEAIISEAAQAGIDIQEPMHSSEKSIVFSGRHISGEKIVFKKLSSSDPSWQHKFCKEVAIYNLLKESKAPFPYPKLFDCSDTTLVIEYLDGSHLEKGRYPSQPIENIFINRVIESLEQIAAWMPPKNNVLKEYDYIKKAKKYKEAGYFSAEDMALLEICLEQYEHKFHINHGDALICNTIFSQDTLTATFFDLEFMDLYLPSFDLALLHTTISFDDDSKKIIEEHIKVKNNLLPFLANKSLLLAREIKMHEALPDHLKFKFPILEMLYEDKKNHARSVKKELANENISYRAKI